MQEGHLPVLVEEVMSMLSPAPGSLQIDASREDVETQHALITVNNLVKQ